MDNHPINGLMEKAMENIKKMVEVNTIVGEAVETKNGTVIIPVTKVSCGFAAGGSQYATAIKDPLPAVATEQDQQLPFGGGSGGGVSVQPVGFLIVKNDEVRFQVVDSSALLDRLIDQVPGFIQQIKEALPPKDKKKSSSPTVENIETLIQQNVKVESDGV